jgi:uncharacterized protein (TIGR02594 family)
MNPEPRPPVPKTPYAKPQVEPTGMPQPVNDLTARVLSRAQSMVGHGGQQAVKDYLHTGGQNLDPHTKAWCAAFVNSTLKQAALPTTGSDAARSFLDYGSAVAPGDVQRGDIAVYPRGGEDSPYGHVGIVQDVDPAAGTVALIGGGGDSGVAVSPYQTAEALGFRRPKATTPFFRGGLVSSREYSKA